MKKVAFKRGCSQKICSKIKPPNTKLGAFRTGTKYFIKPVDYDVLAETVESSWRTIERWLKFGA
jgi:hypothetical protein